MAITDELREYIDSHLYVGARCLGGWKEVALLIADRIDAEHERQTREEYQRGVNDGYDMGFASADDWLAQHEDAMAEHGWIRLPLDADGEVVRIGDVMVMASHPFGCEDKPLVVDRMELSRGMHGEVWCLALDTDRSCWTQAAVLRHHHAPTVEDVLREFALACEDAGNAGPEVERIAAEFAARLRLAEEVDA